MPSFEINRLQAVAAPKALSDTDRATSRNLGLTSDGAKAATNAAANSSGVEIEVNAVVDTASPPVDRDRVAEIREALRDGSYPLVPTEIADAMIAAQLSFGMDQ